MAESLFKLNAGKGKRGRDVVDRDARLGELCVVKQEDATVRMHWTDLSTGVIEDDVTVLQDDAISRKVGKPQEQQYIWVYITSTRHGFYYYLQCEEDNIDFCVNALNTIFNDIICTKNEEGEPGASAQSVSSAASQPVSSAASQPLTSQHALYLGPSEEDNAAHLEKFKASCKDRVKDKQSSMIQHLQNSTAFRKNLEGLTVDELTRYFRFSCKDTAAESREIPSGVVEVESRVAASMGSVQSRDETSMDTTRPDAQLINSLDRIDKEDLIRICLNLNVQSELLKHVGEFYHVPDNRKDFESLDQSGLNEIKRCFVVALGSGSLCHAFAHMDFNDDVTEAAASGNVEDFIEAMEKL